MDRVENILHQIGKPAIKPLYRALKNKNKEFQKRIISTLSWIGKPAVGYLLRILKNNDLDFEVRTVAMKCLYSADLPEIDMKINTLKKIDRNFKIMESISIAELVRVKDISKEKALNILIRTKKSTDIVDVDIHEWIALYIAKILEMKPDQQLYGENPTIKEFTDGSRYISSEEHDDMKMEYYNKALKEKFWYDRYQTIISLHSLSVKSTIRQVIGAVFYVDPNYESHISRQVFLIAAY